jgi:hypothetical protein
MNSPGTPVRQTALSQRTASAATGSQRADGALLGLSAGSGQTMWEETLGLVEPGADLVSRGADGPRCGVEVGGVRLIEERAAAAE